MAADRIPVSVEPSFVGSRGFLRAGNGYSVLPSKSEDMPTPRTGESAPLDGQDRSQDSVASGCFASKLISLRLFTILLSPVLVFMVILGSVSASHCPDDVILYLFTVFTGAAGLLSYVFLVHTWLKREENCTRYLFRIFGVQLMIISFLANVTPLVKFPKLMGDDPLVCRVTLGLSLPLVFGHMVILLLLLWKSVDHRISCGEYVADANGSYVDGTPEGGCGWRCCDRKA